jgi:hypothetical protein
MKQSGLEKHPFMTAVVEVEDGSQLAYAVKPIRLQENCNPYALVNEDGEVIPRSASSRTPTNFTVVMYNGLWIENEEVWTLDILLKEQKLRIGKLVSLTPGISAAAHQVLKQLKANQQS